MRGSHPVQESSLPTGTTAACIVLERRNAVDYGKVHYVISDSRSVQRAKKEKQYDAYGRAVIERFDSGTRDVTP